MRISLARFAASAGNEHTFCSSNTCDKVDLPGFDIDGSPAKLCSWPCAYDKCTECGPSRTINGTFTSTTIKTVQEFLIKSYGSDIVNLTRFESSIIALKNGDQRKNMEEINKLMPVQVSDERTFCQQEVALTNFTETY